MDEKNRKELENLEMEHGIRVIRQDLPGDALQSAKLVLAAQDKKWEEVEKLLEQGADPRICRWADAAGLMASALFYALESKQFGLAGKLFNAGDRLDDLRLDRDSVPAEVLTFLAFEMRNGNNYFYDESKPLSECCRCSAFEQIGNLMDSASQDELNKSIEPTVHEWFYYKAPVHVEILADLIAKGAKISNPEKEELLACLDRCSHWPKVMRPPQAAIEKVTALVRQA